MAVTGRYERGGWARALVIYSIVLAIALLAPTSGTQSKGTGWLAGVAQFLGASPQLATQARAEFLANALILMPVSALGSVVWPRSDWRDWVAWSFVIASSVEVTQGLFLPGRAASMPDVVANTLGGLGGAVFVAVLRRFRGLDKLDHR